ncbi:MAG: alcohol dehydrogenase catalytic domain-containing protein [Bacteroidia bacterium]
MRAIQISKPGGDFELVNREIPAPLANEILIKVEACGVCHGESVIKEGFFPGLTYPRIPGHEVVGTIAKLGSDAEGWNAGDRVGVGWHGGHCHKCKECRKGNFWGCEKSVTTGINRDGGYAEYMTALAEVAVSYPAELDSVQGAPLVCAGRTTFGALKYSGAQAGDVVAIHGLGGLGHLAVQFAVKMGFKTVVISRGTAKEQLAYNLGAHVYIDATAKDAVKELNKLGGARAIICLAPNSKEISVLAAGLGQNGKVVIVTAVNEPICIPGTLFLGRGRSVTGFAGGDIAETLNFSLLTKVLPVVEVFPLEQAAQAYEKMMTSKVHFRAVLKMNN